MEIIVIKRDGDRELYDRHKIYMSVLKAFLEYHEVYPRAFQDEVSACISNSLYIDIVRMFDGVITTSEIKGLIYEKLIKHKVLDVADIYLKFKKPVNIF